MNQKEKAAILDEIINMVDGERMLSDEAIGTSAIIWILEKHKIVKFNIQTLTYDRVRKN